MLRAPVFALLVLAVDPAFAQSPPPLDAVRITAITSATQAERIAADQPRTSRRHTGPVTLVVEERGIGRARLLRIDGNVAAAQASQRPLCGAEVSAGACRPGAPVTGVEITYHLGALPSGTTIAVQNTSAVLPARTLGTEIVLQ